MTKVLKYAFLTILFLFLLLLLLPWLFKAEIFEKVKSEANQMLVGELYIDDISLSLIRDFPNLSLKLYDLKYVGDGEFKDEELFSIKEIGAELDVMSVIGGETINILDIAIFEPKFHVKVLKNGTANYNIMKEDGAETEEVAEESSPFHMEIQSFRIESMQLVYNDLQGEMFAEVKNGNMLLKGDFTETDVAVKTNLSLDELTVKMGPVAYLNHVLFKANIDANYNQETGKVTLGENAIFLNKLNLLFSGWVQSFDEKVAMELAYEAPHSDFKELLSLVPAVYLEGYESLKTSGSFSLKGNVNGDYFYEGDNLPAFGLDIQVNNGKFQYPDLPSSVDNIEIATNISHPQGETDLLVVNMSKASLDMAGSPFFATLLLKTPMSDPDIDFTVKTNLDLQKLTQVVPVEGQDLKGILSANAHIKGKLSQFENEKYSEVEASGWASTKNLIIGTEYLTKEVRVDTAYLTISPQKFDMPIFAVKMGESDFSGQGKMDNLLNYVLADDTLVGQFALQSEFLNVTELMGMIVEDSVEIATEESVKNAEKSAEPMVPSEVEVASIPGNLNLVLKANAKKVLYDDLELTDLKGEVKLKNAIAHLNDFSMDLLNGKLLMDGTYATPNHVPVIDVDLEMQTIDAKTAFTTFNTIQTFAPVASSAKGNFTTKFKLKSALNAEFEPDLNTIEARGNLLTKGMLLEPDVMKTAAKLLKNSSLEKVRIEDADLSFEIKDGRINVKPVDVKVDKYKATFSGSQGLDQTLDYIVATEVPLKNVELPEAIKKLNLIGETIPVKLNIGGTTSNPTVKPVFANSANMKDAVTDIVNKVVEQAKDSAINTINKEAEKIMADAQAQADALMAEAQKQADQIKAEAAKQAAGLKVEARKQADNLVAEAKGDPLKVLAAKAAGKKLVEEADKQIDKLNAEANAQADNIMAQAQKQADKIMADAKEKAKIKK